MLDNGIADRIRAKGVPVVETAGWQTRGSSDFNPRGSVNHHTAGPSSGATPSLNTCIYGRPDLSGPLCNVMQSREPNGNDIAYIVAAGRANHAGSGGWDGLTGNSSVYGLEIEHTGVSPLTIQRQETAAKIHAALGVDPSLVCQHYEWAPTRKIDAATGVDGNHFRVLVRQYQGSAPIPPSPPPGGFDLSDQQYNEIMKRLDTVENKIDSNGGGQNMLFEDLKKEVINSRAKVTKSESGTYWVVTPEGRWPIKTSGTMNTTEMLQWLQILGLVAPGNPIGADNDYLHGVPQLNDPGKVPST